MRDESAPRREQRRERTRERLLQATLELLRNDGLAALSVSGIAKRVGVHHSLFYAHFDTLEDCLAAVAAHVLHAVEPLDSALRREVLGRAMSNRRVLADLLEASLDRWLEHRELVELVLVHRLDQTPLGRSLRPWLERIADDLTSELWNIAVKLGAEGKHLHEVRALADLSIHTFLWALEVSIAGRVRDRRALAVLLADGYLGQNLASFRRMLEPSREAMVAARFPPETQRVLADGRRHWQALVSEGDDTTLVAKLGGLEAAVDAALASIAACFLPQAAHGEQTDLGYVVSAGEHTVKRRLVFKGDACVVDASPFSSPPRCTLECSLRTLVQTMSRERSWNAAFDAGDIRLHGDTLFAAEVLDWFYQP